MTRELALRGLDIPSLHKISVGFDSIFDDLMRSAPARASVNYPPYNIVKFSDDVFVIELAVAGFSEGDIAITQERNVLTIRGEQVQELEDSSPEYLHRGISARNFERAFTLADHVEVEEATATNGILSVKLVRNVPEEQKPKTIAITYTK